ncbi:winged helix-turn-helix domain-containing protein [Methylorubrum extorquens]|uniref:winged helix-turn-helix domain-containing protein n=1 Tax=Methylorubrum extorquens TaxID=408 RepID=UPI0022384A98|nr:winged helix-turn-helix domain-containing protein [Methylorubrum extorquens]UYW25865.1 winged helix-turn-helix domain-containing protein [Methylorubrum extorquens]
MAASPQPTDPRSAHEAVARIRAIQQRQEKAARRRIEQTGAREAAEAVARAEAEVIALRTKLQEEREESEALRARLRALHETLASRLTLPPEWGLSPQETALLLAVRRAGHRVLTKRQALAALFPDDADARHPGSATMTMARLRRRLAAAGVSVTIETHERRGYRLSPSSLAVVDAAVTGAAA